MHRTRLIFSVNKSVRAWANALPIVIAMLLLTSLTITLFPAELAAKWFGRNEFIDVLAGASAGSIAAGHPVASYLLAGELLASGVSLYAVTALIVSWVTVGIVQLPAEILLLGKHFAVYRNLICFVLAIVVAFATVYTVQLFS